MGSGASTLGSSELISDLRADINSGYHGPSVRIKNTDNPNGNGPLILTKKDSKYLQNSKSLLSEVSIKNSFSLSASNSTNLVTPKGFSYVSLSSFQYYRGVNNFDDTKLEINTQAFRIFPYEREARIAYIREGTLRHGKFIDFNNNNPSKRFFASIKRNFTFNSYPLLIYQAPPVDPSAARISNPSLQNPKQNQSNKDKEKDNNKDKIEKNDKENDKEKNDKKIALFKEDENKKLIDTNQSKNIDFNKKENDNQSSENDNKENSIRISINTDLDDKNLKFKKSSDPCIAIDSLSPTNITSFLTQMIHGQVCICECECECDCGCNPHPSHLVLRSILSEPIALYRFREFSMKTHTGELLRVWEELQFFRSIMNYRLFNVERRMNKKFSYSISLKHALKIAILIYLRFFKQGSKWEVGGFNNEERDEIRDCLRSFWLQYMKCRVDIYEKMNNENSKSNKFIIDELPEMKNDTENYASLPSSIPAYPSPDYHICTSTYTEDPFYKQINKELCLQSTKIASHPINIMIDQEEYDDIDIQLDKSHNDFNLISFMDFNSHFFNDLQWKCFLDLHGNTFAHFIVPPKNTSTQPAQSILAPNANKINALIVNIADSQLNQSLQSSNIENTNITPTTCLPANFYSTLSPYHQLMMELKTSINYVKHLDFNYFFKLGEGGFGFVVFCQKKSTKKFYAMKIQPKESLIDCFHSCPRRILLEKEVLSVISNPFITTLHYSFQTPSLVFMALDLAEGGDLNQLMQQNERQRLSENIVVFFLAEVVLALECLHSWGLIYRDLKPQNIVLTRDGHAQLVDLGGVVDTYGCWGYCNCRSCKGTGNTSSNLGGLPILRKRRDVASILANMVNNQPESEATSDSTQTLPSNFKKRNALHNVMGTVGYMAPELVLLLNKFHRKRANNKKQQKAKDNKESDPKENELKENKDVKESKEDIKEVLNDIIREEYERGKRDKLIIESSHEVPPNSPHPPSPSHKDQNTHKDLTENAYLTHAADSKDNHDGNDNHTKDHVTAHVNVENIETNLNVANGIANQHQTNNNNINNNNNNKNEVKPQSKSRSNRNYRATDRYVSKSYTSAVDWWSLGVTAYRLLTGERPFAEGKGPDYYFDSLEGELKDVVKENMQNKEFILLFQKVPYPSYLSPEAIDFISLLLQVDPHKRLGSPTCVHPSPSSPTGLPPGSSYSDSTTISDLSPIEQLKNHPFFRTINWDQLSKKQLTPPYLPNININVSDLHPIDISVLLGAYGKDGFLDEPPSPEKQMFFRHWDYIHPHTLMVENGLSQTENHLEKNLKIQKMMIG